MADQQNVWVVHHDHENWQVKREGDDQPISTHDTQEEAHQVGRQLAEREGVELIVQGRDGKIVDKASFGNDPRNVPG